MKSNLINNFEDNFKNYKFEIESEDITSAKSRTEKQRKLDNFKYIYFHSKELIGMGSLLAMNQGIKATIEDAYKAARKISNIVSNQQKSFIKLSGDVKLKDLDNYIKVYKSLDI